MLERINFNRQQYTKIIVLRKKVYIHHVLQSDNI